MKLVLICIKHKLKGWLNPTSAYFLSGLGLMVQFSACWLWHHGSALPTRYTVARERTNSLCELTFVAFFQKFLKFLICLTWRICPDFQHSPSLSPAVSLFISPFLSLCDCRILLVSATNDVNLRTILPYFGQWNKWMLAEPWQCPKTQLSWISILPFKCEIFSSHQAFLLVFCKVLPEGNRCHSRRHLLMSIFHHPNACGPTYE